MKRTAALVLASALAASPALAQQQPAADNAPGSQTQEMQGRVGTSAGQKAADKPESRGMSGDQSPTTTGAGGSPSPSHTTRPPPTHGDTPREGTTK